MTKCPKCGEELDYLIYSERTYRECQFSLGDEDYDQIYAEWESAEDGENEQYVCPQCCFKIATEEEKAIDFLKGESEKI